MKRRIVLIFALMMIMFVPVWAQTETDFTATVTQDGQGVIITRYRGSVRDMRIPATIQGMPVTEIGREAFGESQITSVVIPAGVTKVGEKAFNCCFQLKTVALPNTLTHIGDYAFYYCQSLTTITLPDSLTDIGQGAFQLSGLTSMTWSSSVSTIKKYMFHGANLNTVIIPEGVTTIQELAFAMNDAIYAGGLITSVTLPSTITQIDKDAFKYQSNLTAVTIPDTVKNIQFGNDVFSGCSKLPLASQATLRRLGYTDSFSGDIPY